MIPASVDLKQHILAMSISSSCRETLLMNIIFPLPEEEDSNGSLWRYKFNDGAVVAVRES